MAMGRSAVICSATEFVQLNYLTKYLELLDTIFLVLKKKPLSKSAPGDTLYCA